jgi:hypothetical protein
MIMGVLPRGIGVPAAVEYRTNILVIANFEIKIPSMA